MARHDTLAAVRHYHYLPIYSLLAIVAACPAVMASRRLVRCGRRKEVQVLWLSCAVSALATAALFMYAVDWGRWIYTHIACLAILLTATAIQGRPGWEAGTPRRQATAVGLLLIYALAWSLPGDLNGTPAYVGPLLLRALRAL